MANHVFVKNKAGIRKLLQSNEMKSMTERYARSRASGGEIRSFVGFDRAKTIIRGN